MKIFTDGKIRKLNYIVHNPNTAEETAKVLRKICVQANAGKAERKRNRNQAERYISCFDGERELEAGDTVCKKDYRREYGEDIVGYCARNEGV